MYRDPMRAMTARANPSAPTVNRYNGRQTTVAMNSGTWAWWLRLPLAVLLVLLLALAAWSPGPAGAASCAVTSPADNGAGTLRARLLDPACDTITFPGDLGPVTLTTGLRINRAVTVDGPGQVVRYTGAASVTGYLVWIEGGTVTLRGLTLQGGRTDGVWGAGLSISGGNVMLESVTLRDNIAANAGGGGIYVSNATLHVINTLVEGNAARNNTAGGGGVLIDDQFGSVAVTISGRSRIVGNQAGDYHGGGIQVWQRTAGKSATLTMTDSTLGTPASPNTAKERGGGLANYGGTATLTNVSVGGNAAGTGGGLYNEGGTVTLTRSTLSGNQADYGGGLYSDRGTTTLSDATIADNRALFFGGGLYSYTSDSTMTLTNATVNGNSAGIDGGGLFNETGAVTLTNTTISGNAAGASGGGLANFNGTATLRFATVIDNTADEDANGSGSGGGLYRLNGVVNVGSSIVAGNRRGAATPDDCGAGIAPQGYNLVGNAPGCPSNGTGDVVLTGALVTVLNPALADNGGATRTHALVPASPAIDRIPLAQCTASTDQRGVIRPHGSLCDIGAVERATQATLAVATGGGGTVARNPAGGGTGPFGYPTDTLVALTAQPDPGQTFTGWSVDGVNQGWANPLTITMAADHAVQATFAPTASFSDVPTGRGDHGAIVALAARGTIRGYGNGTFGPDDGVTRAQMAALIARATPAGPDTPPTTLTPPACLVAGSWDCEDWGNAFTDRGGVDANLWRNAGTLQHYGVALGYGAEQCAARGKTAPCFGPNDPVSYAQTIAFITRAMIAKGYWVAQPNAPLPNAGVPAAHQPDLRTFHHYTGGIPAPPPNWDASATRGWFARALWAALDSYWSIDRVP